MSGFAGRIIFDGDTTTEERPLLVGAAIKHATKLAAWMKTSGSTNVVKAFDLGHGLYCNVTLLEHMQMIHIVTPRKPPLVDPLLIEEPPLGIDVGVADIVSGYVEGPTIVIEEIEETWSDGTTKKRPVKMLHKMTPTERTSERYSVTGQRMRLAIEEDEMFAPPPDQTPPGVVWSEHAHVRPSSYSGAMCRAAQLVLSIGLPLRPTWEQMWMQDHKKGMLRLTDQTIKSAFNLYTKPTSPYVQLRWDYRAAKTDGITFGSDGKPWLVEISHAGVHAFPLYMDPVSTTPEGAKRYVEVSPELEKFFDEFKGFPLGIPMPTRDEFDRQKRAGEVVQLSYDDMMDPFYDKYIMSGDIGWCFNERGGEAHNVCWDYAANGLKRTYHYAVGVSIGEEVFEKWTPARTQLAGRFQSLYEIKKCRRMNEGQAENILRAYNRSAKDGYEAFDELVVIPTLSGSANLRLQRSGYVWHPAPFRAQPQIKFPESLLNGVISFDFTPSHSGPEIPRCDAPMFVCYSYGDQLEVVSYTYDPRYLYVETSESTRASCQYSGGWQTVTHQGTRKVDGNFYSTRFDWREETTESVTTSTANGTKLGVVGLAHAESFFSQCILLNSGTEFWIESSTRTENDPDVGISVAVPMFNRNCYYFGYRKRVTWAVNAKGGELATVRGPETQYWHVRHPVWHWFGGCSVRNLPGSDAPVECIARKVGSAFGESCVSDAVPGGFFYTVCINPETGETLVTGSWDNPGILGSAVYSSYSPARPTGYSDNTGYVGPVTKIKIHVVTNTSHGEQIAKHEEVQDTFLGTSMSEWWWKSSPDVGGSICSLTAVNSCLGADVLNYMDDLNGNTKNAGGPEYMRTASSTCYVGVIE